MADDKGERTADDGDVVVPANAAVAANVLAGSSIAGPDAGTPEGQPADLDRHPKA